LIGTMIKKYLALGGLAAAVFLGSALPARAAEITPVAYRAEAASKFQNRRATAKKKTGRRAWVRAQPAQPSVGQRLGLHGSTDPLELKSAAAFVIDQDTNEVLLSKNSQAVLPIASITKLMTALVVVEAGQPLDDTLEISQADVDTEKRSPWSNPLLPNLWVQGVTEAGEDEELQRYLRAHVREVHEFVAGMMRGYQAAGAMPADRDPAAEAWVFLAGGLLRSFADRLGGVLGPAEFGAIGRERRRWLSGS